MSTGALPEKRASSDCFELSTLSQSSSSNASCKYVSFDKVQVRAYVRIVGDHPDCKEGPPLSLGWLFKEEAPISVDQYEIMVHQSRRRSDGEFRATSILDRQHILCKEFGIPLRELMAAEKEVQLVRKRRMQSLQQGKVGAMVESAFSPFTRKLRRIIQKAAAY
jgi:hypothetical protein